MTPEQCAREWWDLTLFCKDENNRENDPESIRLDLPVKTRLKKDAKDIYKSRSYAISQAQNKFNPQQWGEYSLHHSRISDEIYGKLVRPHEKGGTLWQKIKCRLPMKYVLKLSKIGL